MPAELVLAMRAIAAPAAVAAVLGVILLRLMPARLAERLALPVALAAGFCAGYWLLGEWGSLVPKRHREWLPWLAILAALAGRNTTATAAKAGRSSALSFGMFAALALVAAWLLVPTWDTLWPPRRFAVPLLAVYFLILMIALTALPERLLGRLFAFLLTAAAITVAPQIVIGAHSARIGLVALAAASALGGCSIAACLPRRGENSSESQASASRSLIPAFAVLIGGLAFLGAIEPQEPLPLLLLAPAAPAALWLFAAGPLARIQGWPAILLQAAAVAVVLAIALVAALS
jgi:hypothetical protein